MGYFYSPHLQLCFLWSPHPAIALWVRDPACHPHCHSSEGKGDGEELRERATPLSLDPQLPIKCPEANSHGLALNAGSVTGGSHYPGKWCQGEEDGDSSLLFQSRMNRKRRKSRKCLTKESLGQLKDKGNLLQIFLLNKGSPRLKKKSWEVGCGSRSVHLEFPGWRVGGLISAPGLWRTHAWLSPVMFPFPPRGIVTASWGLCYCHLVWASFHARSVASPVSCPHLFGGGVTTLANTGFIYFKISATLKRERRNGVENRYVKILERSSL